MPKPLVLRFDVDDKGTVKLKDIKKRLKEVGTTLDDTTGAASRHGSALSSLGGKLSALAGIYISSQLIKNTIAQADAWKNAESRLRLATNSVSELTVAQQKLYAVAQESRVAFEGTAELYQRMSLSTKDLNVSQERLVALTDAVAKGMVVSGSSAQAADAAIVQLGQAFSANFQSVGQELASLREQAPRVYRAIIDGLGVTSAEFRKMAEEGELSSEMVIKAIESQRAAITSEYTQIEATVGQSMTVVSNALLKFIGEADKATGFTAWLGNAMRTAAKKVDELTVSFAKLFEQTAPERFRERIEAQKELEEAARIATQAFGKLAIAQGGGFGAGNIKGIAEEARKAQAEVDRLADLYIKMMGIDTGGAAKVTAAPAERGPDLGLGKEAQKAIDKYNQSLIEQRVHAEEVLASLTDQNMMVQNNVGGITYLNSLKRLGVGLETEMGQKLVEQMALRDQLAEGEIEKIASIGDAYLGLRNSMFNEEALWARFAGEAAIIEEAFNQRIIAENERYTLLEQLELEHQARMGNIEAKGTLARRKFEEMNAKQKTKTLLGEMAMLTSGVATNNKTMFKLNKIAALANAGIALYEGVSLTMSKYPYPINIGMAALHGAAAAAQISSIQSQQFGGGGATVTPIAGGGSAITEGIAPTSIPGPTTVEPTIRERTITVSGLTSGQIISSDFARELIETISSEAKDMGIDYNVRFA